MPEGVADVLGQDSERLLVLTGWIGEAPTDGGDVAHLLMHPAGHGVARQMRAAAGMIGLGRADMPPLAEVPAEVAVVQLAADQRDIWVRIFVGDSLVAERPVPQDWQDAARFRGWVILTVGEDPLVSMRDLDRYVSRPTRLHMGRLILVEAGVDG